MRCFKFPSLRATMQCNVFFFACYNAMRYSFALLATMLCFFVYYNAMQCFASSVANNVMQCFFFSLCYHAMRCSSSLLATVQYNGFFLPCYIQCNTMFFFLLGSMQCNVFFLLVTLQHNACFLCLLQYNAMVFLIFSSYDAMNVLFCAYHTTMVFFSAGSCCFLSFLFPLFACYNAMYCITMVSSLRATMQCIAFLLFFLQIASFFFSCYIQ